MQFTLDCITIILNVVLCMGIMHQKYEINRDRFLFRVFIIILCMIAKMAVVFFRIPPLNLLSSCVMVFLVTKLLHKCSYRTAFIYSAVFIMLFMAADTLGILITSLMQDTTISITIRETALIFKRHFIDWILQIVFARIVSILIKPDYHKSSKWHEVTFFILLTCFEIAIFAYVSYIIQDYPGRTFIILMMAGFFIINLYIMYILQRISHSRNIEQKLQLMQQQEQLQMQMYTELQKKYDLSRSVAHDIDRHIHSLKTLIQQASMQNAERYLSDLHSTAVRLHPTIRNQNPMLGIILNILSERCERKEIKLNLDIEDFSLSFMSDMDITTIFSNIFDNAVEACMKVPADKRQIHVTLRNKLGLIILRTVNSYADSHTDKIAYHQGIGLSNVRKMVEQYGGVLDIQHNGAVFEAAVTIPIPEACS